MLVFDLQITFLSLFNGRIRWNDSEMDQTDRSQLFSGKRLQLGALDQEYSSKWKETLQNWFENFSVNTMSSYNPMYVINSINMFSKEKPNKTKFLIPQFILAGVNGNATKQALERAPSTKCPIQIDLRVQKVKIGRENLTCSKVSGASLSSSLQKMVILISNC